jgi:hypothetical protein
MEAITLYVPRQRFIGLLGGLLVVSLAAALLLGSPLPGATVVGTIGLGFCAIGAVFLLFRIQSSAPMLVIDAKGLTDNASATGAGLVPWNAITGADVITFVGQEMLIVHLADPEATLARCHWLARPLVRLNTRLVGSPVCLPLQSLAIERDTLLAAIRARLGPVIV